MTTHTIDITKEHCPMTFVKTKIKLSQIKSGEQLIVILNAGEPLENVPRSAEEEGHSIISIDQLDGTVHRVVIQKAV